MTVAQLLQLLPPLTALYEQYSAIKQPRTADQIAYAVRALTLIAESGVTLQELAALLQALGPILPLLVKLTK